MNGQLNGFHEVFIEEGTFLFTSESVGEGHPGAGRAGLGGAAIAQARPGGVGGRRRMVRMKMKEVRMRMEAVRVGRGRVGGGGGR